jgi:integrase
LRAADVLPDQRLFVEGKHTNLKKRTDTLKPRIVLCADAATWGELRLLAARAGASTANLFLPGSKDPRTALQKAVRRLRRRLPPELRGFTPRWLRHSHAMAAIRAGVDLVSIQRQLGHESLAITSIYLRFAGADEAKYLAAFGLTGKEARRTCPSCGFDWCEGPDGQLLLDDRLRVVLRR